MKKKTHSILHELNNLHSRKDSDLFIETTANNIIESSVNLIKHIHDTYDPQTAVQLERRFVNCIKTGDSAKFTRSIKRIIEDKKSNKE